MKPPKNIPTELYQDFTINNSISVKYNYIDNSSFMNNYKVFSKSLIDEYLKEIKANKNFYYGKTDYWLQKAFKKYPINNKKVAIIGSENPVYECFVLFYGGVPFTIDYHKIETDDKRLNLLTVDEYKLNPIKFDAIVSVSSIEHDG